MRVRKLKDGRYLATNSQGTNMSFTEEEGVELAAAMCTDRGFSEFLNDLEAFFDLRPNTLISRERGGNDANG